VQKKAYLDDGKLWARLSANHELRKAYEATVQFDLLLGQVHNTKNAALLLNSVKHKHVSALCPVSLPVKVADRAIVCWHILNQACTTKFQLKRCSNARLAFERIKMLPVPIPKKLVSIATVAHPRGLFGTELQLPAAKAINDMRTAALSAYWGQQDNNLRAAIPTLVFCAGRPFEPFHALAWHVWSIVRMCTLKRPHLSLALQRARDMQVPERPRNGLLATLLILANKLQWTPVFWSKLHFARKHDAELCLFHGSKGWLKQEIFRSATASAIKDIPPREEYTGIHKRTYHVNLEATRGFIHQLHLRDAHLTSVPHAWLALADLPSSASYQIKKLLAGSVFTAARKTHFSVHDDTCAVCHRAKEDLDHIFLDCDAYTCARAKMHQDCLDLASTFPAFRRSGIIAEHHDIVAFELAGHFEVKFPEKAKLLLPLVSHFANCGGAGVFCDAKYTPLMHEVVDQVHAPVAADDGSLGPSPYHRVMNCSAPIERLCPDEETWIEGHDPDAKCIFAHMLAPAPSAPRAELYACALALISTFHAISLFSDCLCLVDNLRVLLKFTGCALWSWDNHDLWSVVQQLIVDHGVTVTRVKAHVTDKHVSLNHSLSIHKHGNDMADLLAKKGSLLVHAPIDAW
jgi:hypothetical protein